MPVPWLIALYCILIACSSLAGGWLPMLFRMTHLRTQLLMSFVAGLMLGIASLHLLPHAFELVGSARGPCIMLLCGTLLMFLLLRTFHVHTDAGAHDHEQDSGHHVVSGANAGLPVLDVAGGGISDPHAVACSDPTHTHPPTAKHRVGWLGLLFGLGLHTLMDGFALGAAVTADAGHSPWLGLGGLGTFLAVALHKPLDAFAITSVMRHSNVTPAKRTLVNVVFATACPVGAFAFWYGMVGTNLDANYLGYGLAFSAGFFFCIALSDLLPEVHFHDHDRGKLTVALLIGLALAVAIENLPGHRHDHHLESPTAPSTVPHDHDGHRHD